MSSLVMFGFFCVSGSCRVPSLKAGSTSKSAYTCYNATIHASMGGSLRTQIIVGSSLDDVVVADHTIVFMAGKAYLPPAATCEQALLEATFFIPLPGDPSCDAYEFVLPQWTAPFVIGLGRMVSSFVTPTDGQNSSASVVCSDYVWDGKMSSKLIFDDDLLPAYCISSFPRNSLIQFFSLIKDVASGSRMTVDVKSIVTDVDQTSSLGKRKHTATMDSHVTHPSPRIAHPLRDIGLEVQHTTDGQDVDVSSSEDEVRFFLP
ncbi:hypothetical protein EDD17DRAFT_1514487 [Pisolithus thermaeus]|nr:hypothetical protein EV401DRAFT_1891560 [Pisolithus croceorrhizus]KAI6147618.1 hypothetical protein EDD17DRAFT_1514487 [Pisolithus thermaeus]